MDTYHPRLAPRLSLRLEERDAQSCAILHATGNLHREAIEAGPREVVDQDEPSEQPLAIVNQAKAEQAALGQDQVLAARHRLDHDKLGNCLVCGEAIDLRRLRALPAALFRTSCQTMYEQERMPAMRR